MTPAELMLRLLLIGGAWVALLVLVFVVSWLSLLISGDDAVNNPQE